MTPMLGLVTIGQAPRVDLLPDIVGALAGIEHTEHGALDDLDDDGIRAVGPASGEAPLVSRLRDGRSAVLGHHALMPLLSNAIRRCADDGASAVLLLCTGRFDSFDVPIPVYPAEPLAQQGVRALVGTDHVGVLNPLAEQTAEARRRWEAILPGPISMAAADPYTASIEEIADAARSLACSGARWIVGDCIGYSEPMRRAAMAASGQRLLLARTLAARLAAEAVFAGS